MSAGMLIALRTLSFSARTSLRVEARRLFHADQREQLQQVVLQHVAGGAGGVVEGGAGADADVLGHRDLHRVDVLGVPHRLEQVVGEAQGQDVLDRLLAQVVVDAEDVLRGEDLVDQLVERHRGLQVVAERLLHHDPAPAAGLRVVGHPGAGELVEHQREGGRRDGEVERGVARDAVALAQVVQGGGQVVERGVVVERAGDELELAGQPLPDVLAPRGPGALLRGLVGQRLEVAVAPVAAGEAQDHETGRQQAAVGQVVDGRDELLTGQVTGDSEDHQSTRLRDPGKPAVLCGTQRIAHGCHPASFSGVAAGLSAAAARPWWAAGRRRS